MKRTLLKAAFALLCLLAIHRPAAADAVPQITPSLKKLLGGLPIAGLGGQVQGMVGALKKSSCGSGLTGCYATASGPLHLYFFTSGSAQQTFLLVIDQSMTLPKLLKANVQKVLGGTSLQAPMISISTTDYTLDVAKMPADLQQIVRDHYFNVASLEFANGVQLAARANLGGAFRLTMQAMGVDADKLTLRAAVVMPIPTDLASGAGAGAGLAAAIHDGDTMTQAGADALKPAAFVEFQLAPGAVVQLPAPPANLTDATFFIDNVLTFGFKGNANFVGVKNKPILLQFQTPLDPAGAMDLLDFSFRMATPASWTMADQAQVMFDMATPDPRLAAYGGGFIRNIAKYQKALHLVATPLTVFQLRNPAPAPAYRFGDPAKPFPFDPKYYNVLLYGPLAQGGPLMEVAGDAYILGQEMGALSVSAGASGLHGTAMQDLQFKLGPLGRVKVEKMVARADVDQDSQVISLKGNFGGQVIDVELKGSTLSIDVPANCVNPFEIRTSVAIQASTNIADVFEGQGGVNVDPNSIAGCVGEQLKAALSKVANEYRNLGGYSAAQANAQLKQINDAAAQAAAAAAAAAAQAQKDYNAAKDKARQAASQTSNDAMRAFHDADNAFKKLGGHKKKHHKDPDPRFAESVFDWDYYYDNAPDVVKANVDLATHWRGNGFYEGRQGSSTFSVTFYLRQYPDIQAACSGNFDCALQHWLDHGIAEGRQGSPGFSVTAYLNRYPDLQAAFGRTNYAEALDHWINNGQDEGRNGAP